LLEKTNLRNTFPVIRTKIYKITFVNADVLILKLKNTRDMKMLQYTVAIASLLLTAATAITPSTAQAQSLRLGIKAGVNFDKTQGRHLDGAFSGNFLGGAYVGVGFQKVRIQAEALFSQSTVTTGDNFKDAFTSYLSENAHNLREGTFRMNELSIPVLVSFNVVPKLLWLQAGPQYTGVVSINDVNSFLKESEDVFKTGYVSGVVGAELELPLSLNAGLRYVFGISDRNNTNVSEAWRTSHFQVHVGLSLFK
jgi:hypothetical protein